MKMVRGEREREKMVRKKMWTGTEKRAGREKGKELGTGHCVSDAGWGGVDALVTFIVSHLSAI